MLQLLCLFLALVATARGACPSEYTKIGEGCYYFSVDGGTPMTWTNARQYCRNTEGGDLAVFDYLCDDFRLVTNHILISEPFFSFSYMYIGATSNDGSWMWVDGRALSKSSTNWYYQDPVLTSGCLTLHESSYGAGYDRIYFYETGCTGTYDYICQASPITEEESTD